MKYILPVLFSLLFLCGFKSNRVPPDNDWLKMGLKDKVKNIREITYRNDDKSGILGTTPKTQETSLLFNMKGYKTELLVNIADSSCRGRYIYNYDKNNRRTGYRFYDPAGRPKAEYNFNQDHYGYIDHKISYTIFEPNGDVYGYYIYYFDKECNLSDFTNSSDDKELVDKKQYVASTDYSSDGFICNKKGQDKYDIKQNHYKSNYFNMRKDLDYMAYIKYDLRGNIVESIENIAAQRVKDMYSYLNGYQVKHITYIDAQISKRHVSRYDKNGELIEAMFYNYDLGFNKVKYKYDKAGNEIEITYYNPDKTIDRLLKYAYEYDKKGNWIKRYEYEDGKNISMEERIIEYFN